MRVNCLSMALLKLFRQPLPAVLAERIMAPIGLDIGGRTPEETAVSIVAEMIAMRTGRDAPSLTAGEGRIH